MDVLVFTVFVEDSAALTGIVIAAMGIGLSHVTGNPYFDPAASVAIGLVLIGAAGLLARKSGRLLIGQSISPDQLAQVRKIISSDAAVERVGHLLTMRLGPDAVLLTAAVRFQRRLNLDEVEQAIERLEHAIKVPYRRSSTSISSRARSKQFRVRFGKSRHSPCRKFFHYRHRRPS